MADTEIPVGEALDIVEQVMRAQNVYNPTTLAALAHARRGLEMAIDVGHLSRQREWSRATFGPGPRTGGVVDHIRKELAEIEADPADLGEWVDVIILAFDGAWRAGWEPAQIIAAVKEKQAVNEARTWPDWRTRSESAAIEHVRDDRPAAADAQPKPRQRGVNRGPFHDPIEQLDTNGHTGHLGQRHEDVGGGILIHCATCQYTSRGFPTADEARAMWDLHATTGKIWIGDLAPAAGEAGGQP